MIYTVTLNPALDKTVEIPSFTTDGVNRITSIRTDPGGKGINVSKVVAALGSTSRALGILGGSTGQMISEALSGLNMTCDFLPVEGNTRINLKVVDPIAHTSTEINEPGVPVDPATLQSLLDHLLKLLRHDDIVVLAGSLPVNAPADTYRVWGDACREKGAKVILDSDGAGWPWRALGKAVPHQAQQRRSFLTSIGRALDSQQELTAAARELLQTGVQKVIVSMGSRGMLHVLPEQTIFVPGLRVPVKDTVGAGDAVIAALAVAEERGLTLEETLRLSTAAGAASECAPVRGCQPGNHPTADGTGHLPRTLISAIHFLLSFHINGGAAVSPGSAPFLFLSFARSAIAFAAVADQHGNAHHHAQQGGSAQDQQPQLKGLGVKIRFQLFGRGVQGIIHSVPAAGRYCSAGIRFQCALCSGSCFPISQRIQGIHKGLPSHRVHQGAGCTFDLFAVHSAA